MVSCFIAIGIIIFVSDGLNKTGLMEYWWGFFMLCNLGYIIHGVKEGFIKNVGYKAILIATGPLAFFTWTIVLAWRKYKPRRKHIK